MYFHYEIKDEMPPLGKDFKYLIDKLDKIEERLEKIENELINLNTPTTFMTREEVAEYLRVDVRTITNMVQRGELTQYYLGSLKRYKRKEVEHSFNRPSVYVGDSSRKSA